MVRYVLNTPTQRMAGLLYPPTLITNDVAQHLRQKETYLLLFVTNSLQTPKSHLLVAFV